METSWRSCAIWEGKGHQGTAKETTAAHGPQAGHAGGRGQDPVRGGHYLLFGQLQLLLQELVALGQAPVLLQQGLPDACRQLQVPLLLQGAGLRQPGPVPCSAPPFPSLHPPLHPQGPTGPQPSHQPKPTH